MSNELQDRLEVMCRQVNTAKAHRLTLCAVLHEFLLECSWKEAAAAKLCRTQLAERILSADVWRMSPGVASTYQSTFSIPDAAADFKRFVAALKVRSRLADDVVRWLIFGTFADASAGAMRQLANETGLASYLQSRSTETELGSSAKAMPGVLVDGDWCYRATSVALTGRDSDIAEHLAALSLAIRNGSSFALVGNAGVGKSLFARHLIAQASEAWARSADPSLQAAQIRFIEASEFACSLADCRNRMVELYNHLLAHPREIPIFDGFDVFAGDDKRVGEIFSEYFGAWLGGNGRPIVVVARTTAANSPVMRGMRQASLPALGVEATLRVVEAHLSAELGRLDPPMKPELPLNDFAQHIIDVAQKRYPGRAFPEVAVNLARGIVRRAEVRRFNNEEPVDTLRLADLHRHVAMELGLSTELIGRDPVQFYREVLGGLIGTIAGQEHACRLIIEHLTGVALGNMPRTLPRGRFLLVGPPGTGKTFIGQSLARLLGYGSEGFFKYNMSDFANEGDRWRFQGSPPGYEGHATRTIFDDVRQRPSCVVLLDEIDRAHPVIQDLLLSILEGEGKDARNEHVNFSQVIFILTTNQAQESIEEQYKRYLKPFRDRRDWPLAKDRVALINAASPAGLRSLFERGVTQEQDAALHSWISTQIEGAREAAVGLARSGDPGPELVKLVQLEDLRRHVESHVKRSRLDRAFLDRIDAIIPIYPIKEGDLLRQIVDRECRRGGVVLNAGQIEQAIAEAQASSESVRPLLRFIDRERTRSARSLLNTN